MLVPVSMIVSPAMADNVPEVKNGKRQIYLVFPKDLEEKYLLNIDPDEILVPLEITVVGNRAIIRFVKSKNLKIKRAGKWASDMKVRLTAVFCICMKHNNTGGFKLVTLDIRTADGFKRVYTDRDVKDYRKNPRKWA